MGGEDERRGAIIEFWQAVEMFGPQRVDRADRQQRVFQVEADEPLPWEPAHELSRLSLRPNQAWRHIVYVGIYRLDEVFEVLSRRIDPDCSEFTRLWQKVIVAEHTGAPTGDSPRPTLRGLDHAVLDECLTAAIQAAEISGVLSTAGVRISSQIVCRRSANDDGPRLPEQFHHGRSGPRGRSDRPGKCRRSSKPRSTDVVCS